MSTPSAPAPPASDAPASDAPAAPAPAPTPAPSHLLDEEGELTDDFYAVLRAVYLKFAKRSGGGEGLSAADLEVLGGSDEKVMGRAELNAFAQATNGQDLGDDSYKEIVEYLDVTDKQELTFKGFTQLYSLQTQNDHGETVHDLEAWGYNSKTLKPVAAGEKKEGKEKKKDVKA